MPDNTENIRRIASFLWEVAQDLHGAVAKSENQNVILPLTVLRRLDYALAIRILDELNQRAPDG